MAPRRSPMVFMTPFLFIILALVTWRIASLLKREDGPYGVLHLLRHYLGVRYDEKSAPYSNREIGKAILCVWCSSSWIGTLLALIFVREWTIILYGLAMSTIAIIIDSVVVSDGTR